MALNKIKRLFVYVTLITWLFARLDWAPIHRSYLEHNTFPHASVSEWWGQWSDLRYKLGIILCPPCAALAEHYYFVFFEIEAGLDEQDDLLLKHIPSGYEYEGVLSRNGFWWGQGGDDNSNDWKRVNLAAWYLYWLPYTVLWWWLYADDLSSGRLPWWVESIRKWINNGRRK